MPFDGAPSSPRATCREGIDLIKTFEGFSSTVYICPAGWPTVAYGHLVTDDDRRLNRFAQPLSREEGEALLAADLPSYEMAVCRHITVPLHDYCFAALVSFTFNLGPGALQASTMRRMINDGRLWEAAAQFDRWVFAGAQKLPGLVRRRKMSRALFEAGL